MYDLGYIFEEDYQKFTALRDDARVHGQVIDVAAPYVAEMVRIEMLELYGKDAYTLGYKVYTTIESRLQVAANNALRGALLGYDRRHGYKGVIKHVDLFDGIPEKPLVEAEPGQTPVEALFEVRSEQEYWDYVLRDVSKVGNLEPALVLQVNKKDVYA